MAASTILHIGDDLCRRIPVMETAGFIVFHCRVEIPAIDTAFDRDDDYSAIVFQNDIRAVPREAVEETRALSEAPLVLFQNPTVACEDGEFDLIIPALTPPDIWLRKLRDVVQAFRETYERSVQLRKECADLRVKSQDLRLQSARARISPIDPDAFWRGGDGSLPGSKPPEKSPPPRRKIGEEAG